MSFDRYNRQVLLPFIGEEGQKKICAATAVVAGCGALGSVIANVLARAGVGNLRIIDRDYIEESNLQRQVLFDEQDCRENMPKAAAAERKIRQINAGINVRAFVTDINPANVEELIKGADVVVDGAHHKIGQRPLVSGEIGERTGQKFIRGASHCLDGAFAVVAKLVEKLLD